MGWLEVDSPEVDSPEARSPETVLHLMETDLRSQELACPKAERVMWIRRTRALPISWNHEWARRWQGKRSW
jgi:hypothetical protein